MIYRKLLVQLVLRLSLIVILSLSMGWLIWGSTYPWLSLAPLAFMLYMTYRLVIYLNSTNALLSQFFLAVKNEETAMKIQHKHGGKSFKKLEDSMHSVNQIIRNLRIQYQQKEIVSDAIIENAAVGILSFNSLGLVESLNRKGRELLGVHHLVSIKALLKNDPLLVELFQTIKAGESRAIKTTLKQKTLHLIVSCTHIKFDNENWKLLSFTDIKNEMDATELESWQRLISVLTHEIMNSIAPLSSLSETLSRTYTQVDANTAIGEKTLSKTRLGLQVIQEQGEALMHFVDSYRQLTRLPKAQLKVLSIQHLFKHVWALLGLDEDDKIQYEFSLENEDLKIEADEKFLIQVLVNLIQNAQHAIKEKGQIRLCAYSSPDGQTLISISDNGMGIKPEDIKNIFVPFFTTRENGSGIGLSVVRQIIRMHQAKINLESVYGEGCKVDLLFPAYTCSNKEELISYPENVVCPDFFKNEIIYTKEIKNLQTKFHKHLSGTKAEKLDGIEKVIELACWSSKKWIPGMFRNMDADVRLKASWALIQLEKTNAIPDLKAAVLTEKNTKTKEGLEKNLKALKGILGVKS